MEANTWIKQIQYDREKDKPSTLVTTDGWSYTEDSEAGKRAILEQNHRVTLTTNGVHSVNPESGFEGMKKATVTVDVPSARVQEKVGKISNSDFHPVEASLGLLYEADVDILPDNGYGGLSKATAKVRTVVGNERITANGFYSYDIENDDSGQYIGGYDPTLPSVGYKVFSFSVNVPSSGPNTLYAWFPLDGSITRPAYTVSLPPIGDVNVAFIIAGPTGSTMARYDTATVNASGNLEFTINGTAYEYTRTDHGTTYDINLT